MTSFRIGPFRVNSDHWIIPAISIQVKAVACFRFEIIQAIRRDKSADNRIIIAAVQIVDATLRIAIVPARAERVDLQNFRADLRKQIAPGVVFVLPEQVPAGIIDADDIALQVLAVEVLLPVVLKSSYARIIVIIVNDRIAALFRKDQVALTKYSVVPFLVRMPASLYANVRLPYLVRLPPLHVSALPR